MTPKGFYSISESARCTPPLRIHSHTNFAYKHTAVKFDSVSLMDSEAEYSSHVHRTKCEVESALTCKLVRCKMQEADNALIYSETAVDEYKYKS
jgi:hypothetical protein